MADTSRLMQRLVTDLERQGARTRRNGAGGWTVYPPNGSRAFHVHTSPRRPTQAVRLIRQEVQRAGLQWPDSL